MSAHKVLFKTIALDDKSEAIGTSEKNALAKIGHNEKLHIIKVVRNDEDTQFQLVEFAKYNDAAPIGIITAEFRIGDLSQEQMETLLYETFEEFRMKYDTAYRILRNADLNKGTNEVSL